MAIEIKQQGLSKEQLDNIRVIIRDFNSGNKSQPDTFSEIARELPRNRRRLNSKMIEKLQCVLAETGIVWVEIDLWIDSIQKSYQKLVS